MDQSASRSLEITILSAENLRLDGKPVRKDTFVVVKLDPVSCKSTRADHEGGSNPTWNQKLDMDMASHSRFITLQVECRVGSRNRVIGTATIPVSDLLGGYTPQNYLHFLSYRLRDARGEKNGIINFSVKVKGLADYVMSPTVRKNSLSVYASSSSSSSSSFSSSQPTWGMPAHGRVVTGIPVWRATRAEICV